MKTNTRVTTNRSNPDTALRYSVRAMAEVMLLCAIFGIAGLILGDDAALAATVSYVIGRVINWPR